MASRGLTLKLTVHTVWWLPLYCKGVALMSNLTGLEPDWDKVEQAFRRAMRLKIK